MHQKRNPTVQLVRSSSFYKFIIRLPKYSQLARIWHTSEDCTLATGQKFIDLTKFSPELRTHDKHVCVVLHFSSGGRKKENFCIARCTNQLAPLRMTPRILEVKPHLLLGPLISRPLI